MKNLFGLSVAILFIGCGGTGGGSGTDLGAGGTTDPVGSNDPKPLVDNSDAAAYKVLLMGNSHAAGLQSTLEEILALGRPDKSADIQVAPRFAFLADRVNDGESEEKLASEQWTHVVLQAQKYSSTQTTTYPTTAAEYWIRQVKEIGATSIMFPEHPRRNNTWEGQTLWELHSGIASRENTCVAPVGLVWDEVLFRDPSLVLHQADGNHASDMGNLLTALVFYQIISGQPVESLPELSSFGVDASTEQIMKESVSSLLHAYTPCAYEA